MWLAELFNTAKHLDPSVLQDLPGVLFIIDEPANVIEESLLPGSDQFPESICLAPLTTQDQKLAVDRLFSVHLSVLLSVFQYYSRISVPAGSIVFFS